MLQHIFSETIMLGNRKLFTLVKLKHKVMQTQIAGKSLVVIFKDLAHFFLDEKEILKC